MRMKLKILAISFAVVVLLLLLLPLLIPMDTYRDQVQQLATQKLGVPVKIETLRIALIPTPRVNLEGIRVGQVDEIRVGKVAAVLDVTTLFDDVRVISTLDIEQPIIKSSAVALLTPLLAQPGAAATVAIRRITLSQVRLEWPKLVLPQLEGEVDMSDVGALLQAVIRSDDGKLTLQARPQGAGYSASISARQWTPPTGPPIKFDSLTAQLVYLGQQLEVTAFQAQLYGGKLDGTAQLSWGKQWQLGGKFRSEAIEMRDLSRMFSKAVSVSGRISGNGTFSSSAKTSDQLSQKLLLDYTFGVSQGILLGMDLAKAATLFIKQTGQGGETQFDKLSGKLHTAGKQIELRNMQVASGLLAANGHVRISPSKTLHGQVDVELKRGLALVTVPLNVSGTTDAPLVMPTKAAIAGAAAGTAVLGPMGTGIGMKAGSMLDRMFGDQE
jgi:uncharacterized protein involved in outer membrane biogenesis